MPIYEFDRIHGQHDEAVDRLCLAFFSKKTLNLRLADRVDDFLHDINSIPLVAAKRWWGFHAWVPAPSVDSYKPWRLSVSTYSDSEMAWSGPREFPDHILWEVQGRGGALQKASAGGKPRGKSTVAQR